MPTNETGHYKNITALEKMIVKATALGTAYNPVKATIKLTPLQTLLTTAKADHAAVSTSATPFNNAVNDRAFIYQNYKSYATQLLAAFKSSSDASSEKIKDLTAINRKIQGTRASVATTLPVDPNAPVPETISSSQQSYEMKSDHFNKFYDLIASEASYAPNEVDLKLPAILAYKNSLQAANTAVNTAFEAVNNARIKRDKTLYHPKTGVHAIQLLVKEYVKGTFKANSIQSKQMSGIRFTKPRIIFI